MSIIELDSYRPHVVNGTKGAHVVPSEVFKKLIRGELAASDIDDIDDMLPVILNEWLFYKGETSK